MSVNSTGRPRQYIRTVPTNWWTKNPRYTLFIFRELSSAFLAGYAILLLRLLHRAPDPRAFQALVDSLKSPLSIALHLVVLGFALLNTMTTFNLAPRVLKLHRGEEPVPESLIAGAHYGAWIVVSAILLFILSRLG